MSTWLKRLHIHSQLKKYPADQTFKPVRFCVWLRKCFTLTQFFSDNPYISEKVMKPLISIQHGRRNLFTKKGHRASLFSYLIK